MKTDKTTHKPALAKLVEDLAGYQSATVFNPWREHCADQDLYDDSPQQRKLRYLQHLDNEDVRFVLVGEASGYQGCRYSGIPFTSERLLLEGAIPRVDHPMGQRITRRMRPWSEPSATIVWKTLYELGMAEQTVLWNAVPWHPFKPGNPLSNTTPNETDRQAGLVFLKRVEGLFPGCYFVAIGRTAEKSLQDVGVEHVGVRHPANGGATKFREGLVALAEG